MMILCGKGHYHIRSWELVPGSCDELVAGLLCLHVTYHIESNYSLHIIDSNGHDELVKYRKILIGLSHERVHLLRLI